jgi:hypothetical protein
MRHKSFMKMAVFWVVAGGGGGGGDGGFCGCVGVDGGGCVWVAEFWVG